ncbi:MAG: hypothetical protein HY712_01120 [candidate division NC10 bacterium]|nr:hypothetical protein [candidate division NC10 bacterium]
MKPTLLRETAQGEESPLSPEEMGELWADFEAARRRPLATRLRYAFIRTYRPVLDDAEYRSFDSMADYRAWCERSLPSWLGYGRSR